LAHCAELELVRLDRRKRRSALTQPIGNVTKRFRKIVVWVEFGHHSLIRTSATNPNFETSRVRHFATCVALRVGMIGGMRDFERCYAEHAEPLLRFVTFRVGDREIAQDVVADTFERVLRSKARFDPRKSSEKTWIYGIALNLVRDHARREQVAARAFEQAVVPAGAGSNRLVPELVADRDEVRRALMVLPDAEREVVALRFGADLTMPEIAKVIGEKLSTVEGRLYRGLNKLRVELNA
jgi:RNA polymerase sigma-70 factor (ECF subfamily)